jgi:hypothetical protein
MGCWPRRSIGFHQSSPFWMVQTPLFVKTVEIADYRFNITNVYMCTIPIFWLEHVYCTKHKMIQPADNWKNHRFDQFPGTTWIQFSQTGRWSKKPCQNHLPIEMGLKFCTHTWKHQLDPHCFYAPYIIDPIVRLLKHLKTQSMFWNFIQWEFQDPKMEVLYGTVPYKAIFCGDISLHSPYIGHWFMFL